MSSYPLWFETPSSGRQWTKVDVGSENVLLRDALSMVAMQSADLRFVYGALDLGWDQPQHYCLKDLDIPPHAMISLWRDFWLPDSTTQPFRSGTSLVTYAEMNCIVRSLMIPGNEWKGSPQKTTQQLFHLIMEYAYEYNHRTVLFPWLAIPFAPSHMSIDACDGLLMVIPNKGQDHLMQTKLSSLSQFVWDSSLVLMSEAQRSVQDILYHRGQVWVLFKDRVALYHNRAQKGEWMADETEPVSFACLAVDLYDSQSVSVLDTVGQASIWRFHMHGTALVPIHREPLAQPGMSLQTRLAVQTQHVVLYDPARTDRTVIRLERRNPQNITHRFSLQKPRGRKPLIETRGTHGRAQLWVEGDDKQFQVTCVDGLPLNNTTTLVTTASQWHATIYQWSETGQIRGPWRMARGHTQMCALIDRVKGGFFMLHPHKGGANDSTVRGGMFLV